LLETVVNALQAERLADLTAEKLDTYLTGLTCSARTKNTYRGACLGLCNYLVRVGRLADNPLRRVTKRQGEVKRKRRAETAENPQKLLDATARRPFLQACTIHRGKNQGQLAKNVKPATRRRLETVGRGRALLYLFAIHTGLRAGTIRKIKVAHLNLDGPSPALFLPGIMLKNRKDFSQRLRPDLVAELRAWIADTGRKPNDRLFAMPSPAQVCKLFLKDLAFAGIPEQDARGRYFTFHSLRKCKGSFLRQAGIDPSVSMRQMGHSDVRMTMEIYNDEELLPDDGALAATPNLTLPQRT
jgi:integrase